MQSAIIFIIWGGSEPCGEDAFLSIHLVLYDTYKRRWSTNGDCTLGDMFLLRTRNFSRGSSKFNTAPVLYVASIGIGTISSCTEEKPKELPGTSRMCLVLILGKAAFPRHNYTPR